MRARWGWWPPVALAVGSVFILVDFTLFAANLAKIRDGGWIPLAFGGLVFGTMIRPASISRRTMTPRYSIRSR